MEVIAEGEQIAGLVELSPDTAPLCDRDDTIMVVRRVVIEHDSWFDVFACPHCRRVFTMSSAYFTIGEPMRKRRIVCTNDGLAMALTNVSEAGETWSCAASGCGRIELHSPRDR